MSWWIWSTNMCFKSTFKFIWAWVLGGDLMDKTVYVQDDRYEIPEELLRLSQEELEELIKEELDKEFPRGEHQLNELNKTIA